MESNHNSRFPGKLCENSLFSSLSLLVKSFEEEIQLFSDHTDIANSRTLEQLQEVLKVNLVNMDYINIVIYPHMKFCVAFLKVTNFLTIEIIQCLIFLMPLLIF